ncbi:MAG TPA: type I-U CRISPR-associated protein Csb2 [Rhodanobacteraceae bacterium]|nr:type I-U CRISPR-associated protein Csb2 [Rhodanobacteraceae bacterium]
MLALSFTFPGGRYHATPWDRHVNEGAVAWPPEPWRILRALIATWHHKVKHTHRHTETTLLGLLESLATELPEYALPAANHSHTRHYMPQYHTDKSNNTSLIFDAFTAVGKDEPLSVAWPHLELPEDQSSLLDDLLSVMGYLGRAESWVEARRIADAPEANCKPGNETLDTETGELKGEMVTLFAPLPKGEYQAVRERFLTDKKAIKKLAKTLPGNLLDALSVDTADLRKQGWNQPPAAHKVSYLRPVNALRPERLPLKPQVPTATTACFVIAGKPLPRVEDSLRIGELLRAAMLHAFGKDAAGKRLAPPAFSGHDLPEHNRHRHAFYLPWDSNGDGRIDRALVHLPDGMSPIESRVTENLNCLRRRDGSQWRLVLENIGDPVIGEPLTQASCHWQSVTPYLHPWHTKKRFTVEDQIRRECRERGFPEPVNIERLETIKVGNRERHPIHFHRFRSSRRDLNQPDRLGSFFRLTFAREVTGPLALGFACHFGLGLFKPLN